MSGGSQQLQQLICDEDEDNDQEEKKKRETREKTQLEHFVVDRLRIIRSHAVAHDAFDKRLLINRSRILHSFIRRDHSRRQRQQHLCTPMLCCSIRSIRNNASQHGVHVPHSRHSPFRLAPVCDKILQLNMAIHYDGHYCTSGTAAFTRIYRWYTSDLVIYNYA